MDLTLAPFFKDMASGPPCGAAHWVRTSDGVRIRVGHWRPKGTARGTVLLFPGRTEYIEKYAHTAKELAARGYATQAIDWRGQGLADRLIPDRRIGHVDRFGDYQKDVAAAVELARELNLPRPWHLLAHSMGGGIGLRALYNGLPVRSCAFTGPMWGIQMTPLQRPLGWTLSHIAPLLGMGTRLAPSTRPESYVLVQPFEGNFLTSDADMYRMMQEHLRAHPEIALGGPSLVWLREALTETRALSEMDSPDMSCLTILGGDEKIVNQKAVYQRMKIWPRGRLELIPGARHEVLMETPEIRTRTIDMLDELFSANANGQNSAQQA